MSNFPTYLLATLLLSSILFACDKPEEIAGCQFPTDIENSYELIWNDEFDGTEIDDSKWSYDLGDGCDLGICGWGNNELEYYTDRPENAYLENGNLVIKARKESPIYLNQYQYTSSRLVTKNKGDFRYGRVDVKARLPIGQGLWPAIWMLPTDEAYGGWPRSGEIDLMENIGSEPDRIFGTIHYGHDYWRYTTEGITKESGPNFTEDFHVYTLLWNEDCIMMMVDGEKFAGPYSRSTTLPTTWPFDQNFHILLNVAVGGNLPGNPTPATQFPQTMEVDYVRVFSEK
ncbi:glycoside hydrolase family 16 protein [Lewinella cohaerens]|uniref:glycoside hydrolase family 16 protein n=1 Tax=Lewinella cohaerens TaxID=70995 RepID=UPI000367120A|nr:glycoside hydrolase family 16 protein [Lewinella cohaerens]